MKNKRIMIAEDDTDIRESMTILLEDEGYHVLPVKNGQEALDFLNDPAETLPDAIVLDLYMPIMGGNEFLHALQKSPSQAELTKIPVILTSASEKHNFPDSKQVRVLAKPIDIQEFVNVLATLTS